MTAQEVIRILVGIGFIATGIALIFSRRFAAFGYDCTLQCVNWNRLLSQHWALSAAKYAFSSASIAQSLWSICTASHLF